MARLRAHHSDSTLRPASSRLPPLIEGIHGIKDPERLGRSVMGVLSRGGPYRTPSPPGNAADDVMEAVASEFSGRQRRLRLSDSLLPLLSVAAGAAGALAFGGPLASALSAAAYSAAHMAVHAMARRKLTGDFSEAYSTLSARLGISGPGR
jgi:hypothetical protein